ncbi:sensor histidine kinase [Actinocatenispora thailandica]|uniref:sensor histidine kinase n=1 Tax=Actinocatenispora thailandica TaxID=227318 RepID=UPI0031DCC31B
MARLRDARIRTKLGLILIVPITALIGVAAVQLVGTGQDVLQARQAIQHARLADRASALTTDLQTERTLAATLLTTPKQKQGPAARAYRAQIARADKQVRAYRAARADLDSSESSLTDLLGRIDTQLDELDPLRRSIEKRDIIPLSTAVFSYRSLIADLLAYRQTLANVAGSDEAANLARGASAMASHTEMTSQEQEVGIVMLAGGADVTSAQHESFQANLEGQAEALRAFRDAVDADHVTAMERTIAGRGVGANAGTPLPGDRRTMTNAQAQSDIIAAQRYEGDLSRASAGDAVTFPDKAGAAQWTETMGTRVALSGLVDSRLRAQFRALVQRQENDLLRQLIAESAAVSLMVLVAIAIALLTARSMARSLHRLRAGALSVAYQELPATVSRLRDPGTLGALTADDIAAGVEDAVARPSQDEIGQVSEAFNVVHRETVRIAAEQATLRNSVSTMFVNLARRSQLMVDRLIRRIDQMEQGEQNPDRLGQLFHLDHLATQMRRNDENLLVLVGVDVSRARREPAALGDVLRAAQSQVEQYTRVELGVVDMGVDVVGSAVNDLVHLIAELLDNATSFSPPDTVVTAEACWIGNRAYVTITDYGTGIRADRLRELNRRLADPPSVDASLSRNMGLAVVGRLAKHIGATVELRSPAQRGTLAEVVIPQEILESPGHRTFTDPAAARQPVEPPRAARAAQPVPARPSIGLPPRAAVAEAPVREPAPVGADRWAGTAEAVDQTSELPQLRPAESAWFQTASPAPRHEQAPEVPEMPRGGPERQPRAAATGRWQSPADDGWRLAATAPQLGDRRTSGGLPRRDPQAQLVPGSVTGRPAPASRQRSAEAVRGTLSSYHRGLQRARVGDRYQSDESEPR